MVSSRNRRASSSNRPIRSIDRLRPLPAAVGIRILGCVRSTTSKEREMILRYDRIGVEIPSGDPDPVGARAVQELMGGRFGEMSTLMNYTFQSFSFRGQKELRPFYDLIANIAAEEYGHIEAVGATITSMLTGA